MRVATIDIGTNTVLLLVAEKKDGVLHPIEERATITRLGQDVDRTRVLRPDAIERTCACLTDYAARIRSLDVDRIAVVGTSAMRDAGGGAKVSDFVESCLETSARVISGREEARLMFAGATSGLPRSDAPLVAFDVGGGSTEVVRGTSAGSGRIDLDYFESFDIGSVRQTERHPLGDPPGEEGLTAMRASAASAFASIPFRSEGRPTIGIAGTVTTLAAVSLGMGAYDPSRVHGYVMPVAEVDRVVGALAKASLAERKAIAGVHPARADIIVAGGIVVLAVLQQLRAESLQVSDRGVRWGLAEELVAAP